MTLPEASLAWNWLALLHATAPVWAVKMLSHVGSQILLNANLPWSAALFQAYVIEAAVVSQWKHSETTWAFQSEWPDTWSEFLKFKARLTKPSQTESHLIAQTAGHFLSEAEESSIQWERPHIFFNISSSLGFLPDQDCGETTRIESDSQRPADSIFRCSLSGRRFY